MIRKNKQNFPNVKILFMDCEDNSKAGAHAVYVEESGSVSSNSLPTSFPELLGLTTKHHSRSTSWTPPGMGSGQTKTSAIYK